MSFWQNSSQPDLSVTGKATSRHHRLSSGHRAGRGGSTKSNIFGISDTPRQAELSRSSTNDFQGNPTSAVTSSVHVTPEAPRPSSGHPPKINTDPEVKNVRAVVLSGLRLMSH